MCDFNRDERETADKLKKADFSRFSAAHKNKLWQSLTAQSGQRQLLDDELDSVAGGTESPPVENSLGDTPKEIL